MEKNDNKAITKVVQDFVDSWNKTTVDTASCIITAVRQANSSLSGENVSMSEEPNTSATDLNTSSSK